MIEFAKRDNKKTLILFVHGFCGGEGTWTNENGSSFGSLLCADKEVREHYDIAYFSYFTRLLNLFAKTGSIRKIVTKWLRRPTDKTRKNVSIEEIGNLLRTEIRFRLQSYDSLIIVAHSMGGLVTKSAIIKDIEENVPSKIKLFLSLAVPHLGAEGATFGRLVSDNIQIEGLAPLNSHIHYINDRWLKAPRTPITKYVYGVHDTVVKKTSAVPVSKDRADAISVDEDHNSISKPDGLDSTIYLAVREIVMDFGKDDPGISGFELQRLEDESEFDDELFVLKLISAGIHRKTVRDTKELFLNAEYMRKVFDSDEDQRRLADIYAKIRTIYSNSYSRYLHDGITNSGLLLADVHQKILEEDSGLLDAFIPFINAIHKQGMLHQLANDQDEDIWWDKSGSMDSLRELLKEGGGE